MLSSAPNDQFHVKPKIRKMDFQIK